MTSYSYDYTSHLLHNTACFIATTYSTSTCACSPSVHRDISRLEAVFKSKVTDINFWLDEIVIRINTLNNKTGKKGHV